MVDCSFPLLVDSEDYQEFFKVSHEDTILFVRFYERYHTCQKCQLLENKLKTEHAGKVILLEVEDKMIELEKLERKLRKIAKQWTHYHFILSDWFEFKSPVRVKHDEERKRPRLTDFKLFVNGKDE